MLLFNLHCETASSSPSRAKKESVEESMPLLSPTEQLLFYSALLRACFMCGAERGMLCNGLDNVMASRRGPVVVCLCVGVVHKECHEPSYG